MSLLSSSSPLSLNGDGTEIEPEFDGTCREAFERDRERADVEVGERVSECEWEDLRRLCVNEDVDEPVYVVGRGCEGMGSV